MNLDLYLETYHTETRGSWKSRSTVTIIDTSKVFSLKLFDEKGKWEISKWRIQSLENNYIDFCKTRLMSFNKWRNKVYYKLTIDLDSDYLSDISKQVIIDI